MLGLRDRHAVARDDDHPLPYAELHRGILRRDTTHGQVRGLGRPSSDGIRAEGAEEHIAEARFIALDIMIDSRKPDAPSSAPAMISTLFPIAKPVAAAASPAYELSSDTTTGMSAPPIGSTINTPSSSDSPIMAKNTTGFAGRSTSQTKRTIATAKRVMLTAFCPR